MSPGDGEWVDHERRISRIEAWMDDRLVTKEVVDIHMKLMQQRLGNLEDSNTWLMRFVVGSLVGVVVNAGLLAVSLIGR